MKDIRFLLKPKYENSLALVVGIDKYSSVSPLEYAVSDATEFSTTLVDVLGFDPKNIQILLDSEATKRNILGAYLRFAESSVGLDDRIIVFFAGHGHTVTGARGEVGFLVPSDAVPNDLSTMIRWDELTRNADLVRAKHMLFIMDACYGGLALVRNINSGSTRFLNDMLLRYSRQVLTAGKADEVVADSGGPLPNHSVFTGHLIMGLRGAAASGDGTMTASGLMAYVYNRVAADKNSNQTPHYGYLDGDGDFILLDQHVASEKELEDADLDRLVSLPFFEQENGLLEPTNKIDTIKKLIPEPSKQIELHDMMIHEVKRFLELTSEDNFKVQGSFDDGDFVGRVTRYQDAVSNLAALTACLAYWATPSHLPLLQKVVTRSSDRLDSNGGLVAWLSLRWFPIITLFYNAGIAAVSNGKYDVLVSILMAPTSVSIRGGKAGLFVDVLAENMLELTRTEVFKRLPGYTQNRVPMSELLYKTLQPRLDEVLYIGKDYERVFDEFEVLLALVMADNRIQKGDGVWGPVGRFGWKFFGFDKGPLAILVEIATLQKDNWGPLKSGLFGGSFTRFETVVKEYSEKISRLGWH